MCGIIGLFGVESASAKAIQALKLIENRGKDGFGVCNGFELSIGDSLDSLQKLDGKNVLAHALHSIVGIKKQPLKGKGVFAGNNEVYNWKELNEKYSLNAENDSELIFKLIEKKGVEELQAVLDELDGTYAFAYWIGNKVFLARDILGVKPCWISFDKGGFSFASEKKALKSFGIKEINELNPRQILVYDLKSGKKEFLQRKFFSATPEHKESIEALEKKLELLLNKAIDKRVPSQKLGLLFSGGVDSTLLAFLMKKKGLDFTCYTSAIIDSDLSEPHDLIKAKEAAEILGLNLKIISKTTEELKEYLPKVIPLLESNNVVRAGVGLTMFLAAEKASKDGCKVIFSGSGSDELFGGYSRMNVINSVNNDALSMLRRMYENDLYRDDVVTMHNKIELRLPFLDKSLVDFALKIPGKFKITDDNKKFILRKVALSVGMPEEIAFRPKKAAQYGSNTDKAIAKLSRQQGFDNKSLFLKQFYEEENVRLGILFSSGKDSCYAMQVMNNQNYEIACLISMKSENKDSFMFHTPNINLVSMQAEALGIPLLLHETKGEEEKELIDLKDAIQKAKDKYKIQGIVSGALYSNYQRNRIEEIADSLGLKVFSPLWHKYQKDYMIELITNGVEFIIASVSAQGLNESWLGRQLTLQDVEELERLNKKTAFNISFEGGEAETLVLNSPMFKKKLVILASEKHFKGNNGFLEIKKIELKEK